MWLKGQSTWSAITPLLTQLIAGEVADGSGNTVPAADAWPRVISGQDLLRPTDTSHDFNTGNINFRQGYFYYVGPGDQITGHTTWIKVTNVATSAPATAAGRYVVGLYVNNPVNTVAGNYSNASVAYQIYDADTGTAFYNGNGLNFNSAGVATLPYGIQIQCGDPSGILQFIGNQYTYFRMFTTTYPGGIDFWGYEYPKRRAAATIVVAPTGTAGTDYDANVSIPTAYSGMWQGPVNWVGSIGHGLGIKTNTGLSGAQYTVSYTVCPLSLRLEPDPTAAGQIKADTCVGGAVDTVYQNPTFRPIGPVGNVGLAAWLRPYQTSLSVTNASVVQYWLSVKKDKVVIILNADPGQTGKMTLNVIQAFTPGPQSTFDKIPVCWGNTCYDYTGASNPVSSPILLTYNTLGGLISRQNGKEGRDWQTGWGRGENVLSGTRGGDWGYYGPTYANHLFYTNTTCPYPPTTIKPSVLDGGWHLYAFPFYDYIPGDQSAPNASWDYETAGIQRGTIRGLFWLPANGWANGDELTDTSSGNVYFCVAADYPGFMGRMGGNAPYYGGIAVLEE